MSFKDKSEAAGYLAAMIDGEGCIQSGTYRNKWRKAIVISNTDPVLIAACAEACDLLGIHFRIHNRKPIGHYQPQQDLTIGRYVDMRRVHEVVAFRSPLKVQRLQATLDYYENRSHPYHWFDRKPSAEILREQYVVQRWSTVQMSRHFGCSSATIGYWLRGYGIPMRSLSTAVKLAITEGRAKAPIRWG